MRETVVAGTVSRTIVGTDATTRETADGTAREIACKWAVPGPDGRAHHLTAVVPYTGPESADAAFDATLPEAEALFRELWGMDPVVEPERP